MVKDNRIPKVTVIKNETMQAIEEVTPNIVETALNDNMPSEADYEFSFDPEAIRAAARRNI